MVARLSGCARENPPDILRIRRRTSVVRRRDSRQHREPARTPNNEEHERSCLARRAPGDRRYRGSKTSRPARQGHVSAFRDLRIPLGRSEVHGARGYRLAPRNDYGTQSQARQSPAVPLTERGGRSHRRLPRKGTTAMCVSEPVRHAASAPSAGSGTCLQLSDLASGGLVSQPDNSGPTCCAAPALRSCCAAGIL
jgi:hypothetical protein